MLLQTRSGGRVEPQDVDMVGLGGPNEMTELQTLKRWVRVPKRIVIDPRLMWLCKFDIEK